MKKILLLTALFLTSMVSSYSQDQALDIDYLDYGANAPFDRNIDFTGNWESAGWSFTPGDVSYTDLSAFTSVVIETQARDFAFQVKVRYYADNAAGFTESAEVQVAANQTSVEVPLDDALKSKVIAIFLQDRAQWASNPAYPSSLGDNRPAGLVMSVRLTNAYLRSEPLSTINYYTFEPAAINAPCSDGGVYGYPSAQLNYTSGGVFEGVSDIVTIATPVANGNPGNALSILMSDYNQVVNLPIYLPAGVTAGDIARIMVDIAVPRAATIDQPELEDNNPANEDIYKALLISIDGVNVLGKGGSPKVANADGTFMTNSIDVSSYVSNPAISILTAFNLYIGVDNYDRSTPYLMDNIKLVLKGGTEYTNPSGEQDLGGCFSSITYVSADSNVLIHTVEGGIFVESDGAKTTVYAVDGITVASTFNTYIPLQAGLYIVKVGNAPAAKVIVK